MTTVHRLGHRAAQQRRAPERIPQIDLAEEAAAGLPQAWLAELAPLDRPGTASAAGSRTGAERSTS